MIAGIVLGIILAVGTSRLLEPFLQRATSRDPGAFEGSAAVLVFAAFVAIWLLARQAARVAPTGSPRSE